MLFGILRRLCSASIIATALYTLLGGTPMDVFIIFSIMFLIVWPQEWVIDQIRKYGERRNEDAGKTKKAPCKRRRSA